MRAALQKLIKKGFAAFVLPEILQKTAIYQTINGITPRNTILDWRSEEQMKDNEQGVEQNTLNEKLNPYTDKPTIINSTHKGEETEPSLHHSEILELIVFLHRDPENNNQTTVNIYSDKRPFTWQQKVVIPFDTYRATFSIERRSADEINKDRSIFVGLTTHT